MIIPAFQSIVHRTLSGSESSFTAPPKDGGGADWSRGEAKHLCFATMEPTGADEASVIMRHLVEQVECLPVGIGPRMEKGAEAKVSAAKEKVSFD